MRTIASINHGTDSVLDIAAAQQHTSFMGPEMEPAALFAHMRDDLGHRRIRHGIATLERMRPSLEALEPRPGTGVLVGLLAQWVDAGFDGEYLLLDLLARFPKSLRATLPLPDYLHLKMADGVAAMSHEDFDGAAAHFQAVLSFQDEIEDGEMLAIANFWIGRCFRKRGRYDDAFSYTKRGEGLALSCGYLEMAAIMQVTLSWLAFQTGKLTDANAILRRAEQALTPTDDHLTRGNIQSAYGRIARRQGKYEIAVGRFRNAICEFRIAGGASLAMARTLVNLAFVERLLAEHAQKELDHLAAVRRGRAADTGVGAADPGREQRLRIEEIRASAWHCLEEAAEIYSRHENHKGIAGVQITRGYLHLDSGDLERAAAEAAEALAHGSGKSDMIVMARARILQCMVEHSALEEQLGDPREHREAAEIAAREAVEYAGSTQNRRLLARALVWQGLTSATDPIDAESARRCCDQALALLQPEGLERQYVWDDLEHLKARVLHSQPIDALLRAWSSGIVEGQSFRQISEEFARIVIPRVWEREERKVSRVAEKLSISPKKVRRILHAAGIRRPT